MFKTKAANGRGFFLLLRSPDLQFRLSHFPDSGSGVAFFRRLLSIMAGAQRGFGPPGRKLASRLSSLIASARPVEVAKKCLLTA